MAIVHLAHQVNYVELATEDLTSLLSLVNNFNTSIFLAGF